MARSGSSSGWRQCQAWTCSDRAPALYVDELAVRREQVLGSSGTGCAQDSFGDRQDRGKCPRWSCCSSVAFSASAAPCSPWFLAKRYRDGFTPRLRSGGRWPCSGCRNCLLRKCGDRRVRGRSSARPPSPVGPRCGAGFAPFVRARCCPDCALRRRISPHGRRLSGRRWDSLHSGRRPRTRRLWQPGLSKERRSLCDDHQTFPVAGTSPTREDPCQAWPE